MVENTVVYIIYIHTYIHTYIYINSYFNYFILFRFMDALKN